MHIKKDEPLWVEKFRPQTVAETILCKAVKEKLQGYAANGLIPNVIFAGGPGVGKTTAARAIFSEIKADFYFINGSMRGTIDTLRTDIADFASSVSLSGGRKYVLLDEADYLNPNSTQPALRGFIEEFSKNCGFILTCNYPTRIIEPLHSRCPLIDFYIPAEEREEMAYLFFQRAQEILDHEKVKAEPEVLASVITKFFPDWRKVLNILQNSVKDGTISSESLQSASDEEIRKVFQFIKDKNFTKIREWAAQHGTDHPKDLFRTMYDLSPELLTPTGQATLALTANKYEYNAAFVANQEINLVAAMVELMMGFEKDDYR